MFVCMYVCIMYVCVLFFSLLTSMFHYRVAILHAKSFLLQSLVTATNRKAAGSIPDGVSGFFIDIKSFR